jgi:hypothetical protein
LAFNIKLSHGNSLLSQLKTNFAVSVESSDAGVEHPILFVVRQQKAITSWELPYVIESSPGYQYTLKMKSRN